MTAHKKLIHFCLIIFTLLSAVCLCGCTKTGRTESSDIKETFLTVFFTSNYEGRYDAWLKLSADNDSPAEEKIEEAITEYYESVRDLVSDDLYEKMILNREIWKYDKAAYDDDITVTPSAFEFAEYSVSADKTTYSFTVHLIKKAGNVSLEGTAEGQITEQRSGDSSLITNLWLSRSVFTADDP